MLFLIVNIKLNKIGVFDQAERSADERANAVVHIGNDTKI